MGDGVARHRLERRRLVLEVARLPADDDAELDLPVGLLAGAGDVDVVVRPDDRVGRLEEHHRLRRHVLARLPRVVDVVQADADHLRRAGDARPHPLGVQVDNGQAACRLDLACQPSRSVSREEGAVVVVDQRRDVDRGSVFPHHAGSFLSCCSNAKQSHQCLLESIPPDTLSNIR